MRDAKEIYKIKFSYIKGYVYGAKCGGQMVPYELAKKVTCA
jgi:hypothetical protein